jgi:pyruvate dehydrogenase (quinone)
MSKRGADVLIETLRTAGVERCYGIVGDTLNQLLLTGARRSLV